jgi:hypothetical protein
VRVGWGGALVAVSLTAVALVPLFQSRELSVGALFAGWTVCGAGMGLCYLELVSRIFDQPNTDDGITAPHAASAAVIVEVIATALATTATASAFSIQANTLTVTVVFTALVVIAIILVALLHRTLEHQEA